MGDASSYTGRRVVWRGPVQADHLAVSYRRAVDAGARRPPTADERRQLAPGDLGTVGELVDVDDVAGHFYVVAFDHGVELEIALPGTGHAIRFVDQPDATLEPAGTASEPRYADRGSLVRRWLHALVGRRAGA